VAEVFRLKPPGSCVSYAVRTPHLNRRSKFSRPQRVSFTREYGPPHWEWGRCPLYLTNRGASSRRRKEGPASVALRVSGRLDDRSAIKAHGHRGRDARDDQQAPATVERPKRSSVSLTQQHDDQRHAHCTAHLTGGVQHRATRSRPLRRQGAGGSEERRLHQPRGTTRQHQTWQEAREVIRLVGDDRDPGEGQGRSGR